MIKKYNYLFFFVILFHCVAKILTFGWRGDRIGYPLFRKSLWNPDFPGPVPLGCARWARLRLAVQCGFYPSAFIDAIIGSEKNTGSTRSMMSPDTSRKFRLFSSGTNARRAPLSIAT